jgi:hypothetical protein
MVFGCAVFLHVLQRISNIPVGWAGVRCVDLQAGNCCGIFLRRCALLPTAAAAATAAKGCVIVSCSWDVEMGCIVVWLLMQLCSGWRGLGCVLLEAIVRCSHWQRYVCVCFAAS